MNENSLKDWPPIEGRYQVGNKNSPIAVCTLASIDEIEVDLNKVAIVGKCVTENIGIEKIIQNVVSNQNIRYLLLCGRESKGHFVAQALESLKKNGIDKEKKIVGATGSLPHLKNIDESLIQRFREQVEIVNQVGLTDSKKIREIIEEILKEKKGKFEGEMVKIERIEEIEARPATWISDPNGYFLVAIDKEKKKICIDHYQNGKINKRICGKNAKEICDTIAKLNLVGSFIQTFEHSMYLARELQKAEIAFRENLDFEQDQELKIEKAEAKKESADEYGWFD